VKRHRIKVALVGLASLDPPYRVTIFRNETTSFPPQAPK